MIFENMISNAVHNQVERNSTNRKTDIEMDAIVKITMTKYLNNEYDFSKMDTIVLKQNDKKRLVKQYKTYSVENILCICIKQILDKIYKIKYVNRNKTVHNLFGILSAIPQMQEFTIVKFDFKNFFNSISSEYVFEYSIKDRLINRDDLDLIKMFCSETKYAYAGLPTSNIIAEIIAKSFDKRLKEKLPANNIVFYERYIDDCLIILNTNVELPDINEILDNTLKEVFFIDYEDVTKCKVKFNSKKFQYISHRQISNGYNAFDYLGYEFTFVLNKKSNVVINYGITQDKINKYNKKMDKIISVYKDEKNLELLKHRIECFCSREVYLCRYYKTYLWKVKGFISNYCELRYLLDTDLIDSKTKFFLENMVIEAFKRANMPIPNFLKNSKSQKGFNLFNNMKGYKTILMVENVGYDYRSLCKRCEKIGIYHIDENGNKRTYETLVRLYLIKTNVGY